MADDLKILPPPKPSETYGNVGKRRRTVTTGHAKRQIKGLTQLNVKVRQRAKDRFEAAFAAVEVTGMTRGELLEAMIDAYSRGQGARAAPAASSPPPADAREGRTEELQVFATPELAAALARRAKRYSWTLSATVEHACAVAQQVELAEDKAP
jgi:hypothetical protein